MAIPVDAETRTALQAPVKQLRSTITWTGTDMQPHTMTSEDRIISIKKEAEGYYFASALRKITITTSGTGTELMDQDVAITIQVKKADQTWGNLPWGTFRIEETTVSEDKGTTTYTGYGGVYKLQQREYIGGELNFPTTVGGLIKQVAEATGLIVNGGEEILPAEYQSIEYIQSSGTQSIKTGITFDGLTSVEAEFFPGDISSSTIKGVFGKWDPAWGCQAILRNNGIEMRFGSTNIETGTDLKLNDWNTIRLDTTGLYLNGVAKATYTKTALSTTSTVTIPIFKRADGEYGDIKLKKFRVSKNNQLVADYHPAIRRSDNKPGLYDTVGGVFYTNAGTGEFIAGPETHWLPNADAPITEDLYARITGTTYRDILEEIAGATGTLAVIGGGDDTLDFNQPPIDAPTDTMTEDNLVTFKIGPEWGPVNAVVLSRQPQGDNIEVTDQESIDAQAGYNWIQYSNTFRTGSAANGITPTILEDGTMQVVCAQGNGNWHTSWWDAQNGGSSGGSGTCLGRWLASIKTGEQFTISFTIKKLPGATGMPMIYMNSSLHYQAMTGEIGTEYSEIHMTQNWAGTNIPIHIGWQDCTGTFIIKNWQLKKGGYAPYEPYRTNGRTDLTVVNNQILDDQRETTATPILDAVKGWEYREATLKTEGHGYHEIGDRIDVTIGGQTFPTVITKSVIIVDGGINETLTSTTPTKTSIDYSKTGGITKTIYNTELAVDKQGQEIVGIVSRQDQQDETIAENYTRIIQNINSIVQTVQVSGGGNLIKNSVGFGKNSDGTLTIWQYGAGADTTTVRSQSSTASLNAGGISGHEIDVNGATISQTVQLTAGELYNLSCRVQKQATGTATITINDGVQTTTLTAQASTAYEWNQLNADFTPQTGSVTITITTTEGWTSITDLMLAQGGITGWRQASGEIYNLQVSVDQDGVQVKSATYAGDYVQITPLEFAGYSNAGGAMKKVFTVNRDTTEVAKLQAESMIKMPPMEIVPIDNANFKGWAIVKAAE